MSLTARERHNPPPRRKSCAACIKAKRRCDAAMPACCRCSQRRISCEYPRVLGRPQRVGASPVGLRQDDVLSEEESPPMCQQLELEGNHAVSNMDALIDTGLSDFSLFGFSMDDTPMELTQQQSSMLVPPTRKELIFPSDVVEKRLQYSIDVIKNAPSMMVLETQTPWSHPLLYREGMPRSMQDAHASCALYMAKNRVNAPVILRSIECRVNDLLDNPSPNTPLESLAHTQSLILYQIIRLFDGDITARASAERAISALETSALCLLSHITLHDDTDPSPDLPLYPLAPTKAFWNEWIFQESARRTILLVFYFQQAYRILAGHDYHQCDGKLGLIHSWTLSGHLWGARTPVAFAEAWRNKKHFVVTNAIFTQVLEDARADDIDGFGKMMIASLLGVDETEGWFLARGGSLHGEAY